MGKIGKLMAAGLFWSGAAVTSADDLSSAADDGLRYPNGDHWTSSSQDEKLAYLTGIGNAINVEFAYQMTGHPPPGDTQTLVQRAHRGFSAHTVADVAARIDQWYARHPEERGKTVVDVIWLKIVNPVPAADGKR